MESAVSAAGGHSVIVPRERQAEWEWAQQHGLQEKFAAQLARDAELQALYAELLDTEQETQGGSCENGVGPEQFAAFVMHAFAVRFIEVDDR